MTSETAEKCIEHCNKLLRGELSAVETYEQAIEKFNEEPEAEHLKSILTEHAQSVVKLSQNVERMGGVPDEQSGAWGSFAGAVVGSAKLLGESSAVAALKQGEEHGKNSYEEAINSGELMPECETMIRSELLPRQIRHIETLEKLPC